ncbi:hypothetical protein [Nocardia sp. CNY236]|uniref:hypothetical protein n=1 Tax=Nocardia sp. CNY236 TaxID=1169152 RepID=UPI00041040A1|nr:hypothetical protein [Nocardia sp. CNY236]
MITAVRAGLLLAGLWLGWYGITLLLEFNTRDLMSVALWFGGGILLHDAVFAPLSAAIGLGARRLLPAGWWAPAACGAVCTVALTLIAAPVVGRRNAMPDNATVLDRNYSAGLMIALITVWALVVVVALGRRWASPAQR